MEHWPLVAMFLKTLFDFSLRIWHALRGVESINDIPVHVPKQQVFKNTAIGIAALRCSSTNRLYDTV